MSLSQRNVVASQLPTRMLEPPTTQANTRTTPQTITIQPATTSLTTTAAPAEARMTYRPVKTTLSTTKVPPITNYKCGISDLKFLRIFRDKSVAKGDFPW